MNREMKLIEYLPEYEKGYEELVKIFESTEPELHELNKEIEKLSNNQFVVTADENGIKRFEKLVNIFDGPEYQIEERRKRVIVRWNEDIPYTYIALKRQMDRLCGEDGYIMDLYHNEYLLEIYIKIIVKDMYFEVVELLKRVMPCNIDTRVYILNNKHKTFEVFKIREIQKFRHRELKEEFISRKHYLYQNIEHEEKVFGMLKESTFGKTRRKGEWYIG